jgi:hypothetical protein
VILLPVWMVQYFWSPEVSNQIAPAPDAARYCSARFLFGAFASMAWVDSEMPGDGNRWDAPLGGSNPDHQPRKRVVKILPDDMIERHWLATGLYQVN